MFSTSGASGPMPLATAASGAGQHSAHLQQHQQQRGPPQQLVQQQQPHRATYGAPTSSSAYDHQAQQQQHQPRAPAQGSPPHHVHHAGGGGNGPPDGPYAGHAQSNSPHLQARVLPPSMQPHGSPLQHHQQPQQVQYVQQRQGPPPPHQQQQQQHYVTYPAAGPSATPQYASSAYSAPAPAPSPRLPMQRVPSHPFPPQGQPPYHPTPSPAPPPSQHQYPSPTRSAHHFSPQAHSASPHAPPSRSAALSQLPPSHQQLHPPPSRGVQHSPSSTVPPGAQASSAALQAQAQGQAQAQAQLQAQAQQMRTRAEGPGPPREGELPMPPQGARLPPPHLRVRVPVEDSRRFVQDIGSSPEEAGATGEGEQRAQLHVYLLDYLQKAGFHSTAAVLLSEAPEIPTTSSRTYPASTSVPPSATSASFPGSARNSLFFTSPSSFSPLPLGPAPLPQQQQQQPHQLQHPSPQRKDAAALSPVSPLSSSGDAHIGNGGNSAGGGKTHLDTVASTASTASTTSHYGFDALGLRVQDDECASPAKSPMKRNSAGSGGSSRKPPAARTPAAQVQIDAPQGFLFEWWSVFWDVYRAKAASASRPGAAAAIGAARSFVQSSSAAVEVALQRQAALVAQGRASIAGPPGVPMGRQPPPPQQQQVQEAVRMRGPLDHQHQHQQSAPGPSSARPPIPLRTTALDVAGNGFGSGLVSPSKGPIPPGPASPVVQQSRAPSRMITRRGAVPPEALPDEALPAASGPLSRRPSSAQARSAQAHALALQKQQAQQAEIDFRMAQAKVHAKQITERQQSQGASPAGHVGAQMSSGPAASPGNPVATPPIQAFSPNALDYNPERLHQASEARNQYRARLVANQQTQLENAKRALSDKKGSAPARRASASAASAALGGPADDGDAGNMPPPASASRRGVVSQNSTPQSKDLVLPPLPGATGEAAMTPGAGKRKRSLQSVAELRDPKKRATEDAEQPKSGASAPRLDLEATTSSAAPAVTPKSEPAPGDTTSGAPTAGDLDFDASDAFDFGALDQSGSALGFDPTSLEFDPTAQHSNGSDEHFSLEQIDALLLSTSANAVASTSYTGEDTVAQNGGGDAAAFNYDDFMNSFGNDGATSYDPTVRAFDLAV